MIRKIFPPLTSDVVGNDDVFDPSFHVVCESSCKSVVDVGVPD